MSDKNGPSSPETGRNRLAREKSPYLLQHAGNPVDWHPWGEEAFGRARREDRPVFLSIGYSTCHWCHVMERESFADPEVARVLNETFVCVKVDREERPDIDQHYMAVCQALTGSGGWPLTILMTPEKQPFFAGTYFPRERRWGRIGLLELVPRIREIWETRRDEVLRSAGEIVKAVGNAGARREAAGRMELGAGTLDTAFRELAADFDEERGGFGRAPKFPTPHQIGFLLRYWKRTGTAGALAMAEKTLESMRRGGIYDQLGWGFHRYSTDAGWLVPHFEKMLYDQAQLTEICAEAYLATGKEEFRRTAAEIAEYVGRELTSPEGAFFTAEDADSEGEEGRFYLWTREEIAASLGEPDAELAARFFGVEPGGNFAEPGRARDGRNVLHLPQTAGELGAAAGIPEKELMTRVVKIGRTLFTAREGRARPFKDTKILADWNGLMIGALARLFRVTGEERHLLAAGKAADFVLGSMRSADGRLVHMMAAGESRVPGFLDDYAFLIKGLIELYEAGFDVERLEAALELAGAANDLFRDEEDGGFFFTAANPELPARRKDTSDGAVPSGNSVMLMNLLRLARMTGRQDFEEAASRMAGSFASEIGSHPRWHTEFLCGLDFAIGPSREVVIVGRRNDPQVRAMVHEFHRSYLPNTAVLLKPSDEPGTFRRLERIAPFTREMKEAAGRPAAYVCSGGRCVKIVDAHLNPLDLDERT